MLTIQQQGSVVVAAIEVCGRAAECCRWYSGDHFPWETICIPQESLVTPERQNIVEPACRWPAASRPLRWHRGVGSNTAHGRSYSRELVTFS